MKNKNIRTAEKLLKKAASNEGLLGLRSHDKRSEVGSGDTAVVDEAGKDIFGMFEDVCLVHMVPKTTWNKSHTNKHISKMLSIADEAFAMLVLENMSPDLALEAGERNRVTGKTSKPKCTKSTEDGMGRIKGW